MLVIQLYNWLLENDYKEHAEDLIVVMNNEQLFHKKFTENALHVDNIYDLVGHSRNTGDVSWHTVYQHLRHLHCGDSAQ